MALGPRNALVYAALGGPSAMPASSPNKRSGRPTWCAPLHASIATSHPAGNTAHQA